MKAFFAFVLIVVAAVLIIWIVSTLTGTASVATVKPEQIPTIPPEGISMFRHLLGF